MNKKIDYPCSGFLRLLHLFMVCIAPRRSLAAGPVVLLSVILISTDAQTGQTGVITGRVIADDGSGVSRASVGIRSVRSGPGSAAVNVPAVTTDEDGNFRFTDLAPQVYEITVSRTKEYAMPSRAEAGAAWQRYHRVGDHVTITLIRGGVITGRVTTPEGEPVVGAPVSPSMVRDAGGNPVRRNVERAAYTDDRGVYRLFGLPPGAYVVSTHGGGSSSQSSSGRQPRVYHPSSTGDTATEVTVVSGGEVGGVDLLLRSDPGRAISGTVVGGGESSPYAMANVFLTNVATGASMFGSARRTGSGSHGFAIYGVADGEYEIVARRNGFNNEVDFASSPRRVTVKGSDVNGIELRLAPLGSISGEVAIEPSPGLCESKARFDREEMLLFLRRREKPPVHSTAPSPVRSSGVDDEGEFAIASLEAGTYHIESQLPADNWYVRSMTIARAAPAPGRAAAQPAGVNVSTGIVLKPGNKLTGVKLVVAEGAAGLQGRIVAEKEGATLPSRLRIHLVPSETTAANELLRYAETEARGDGKFEFKNLAPGKYWLTARAVAEPESADRPALPAAWDDAARTKLRKEAEAQKIEVELKPCQRVSDQVVKF
jgi:Carboxypeptidase regulatory-like domain